MEIGGPAPQQRVHVQRAQDWGSMQGTDYWAHPGNANDFSAGSPGLLTALGWVATGTPLSLVNTGGDLLSRLDRGTPMWLLNLGGDNLESPAVVGAYEHLVAAEVVLGRTPRFLYADAAVRFATFNNNDAACYVGLGTNEKMWSNGVNLRYSNGGGAGVLTGPAADASWREHRWKYDTVTGQVEWFVDDVSYGTLPFEQDTWPRSWYMQNAAIVANQVSIGRLHCWVD